VAIDGVRVAGMPFARALGRIVGPAGSPVTFLVRHGKREREYHLVRSRVSAPVVQSKVVLIRGRRVGYVRLAGFRLGAAQVLRSQVERLERAHVSALVLDLRENPGGLLDQAVSVVSLFVDRGVVCSVESARHREVLSALGMPAVTRLPLAVLVDRYSASAAEVVAAALHDNRRAILVGESTFGKALVQTVTPLANGAALKLTTARYLTPSGADINHRGVRPDVVAVDDPRTRRDEALAAAVSAVPS
jgi:carboxyl-terminal processing protease